METKEQIRQRKNLTAESLGSLSLGVFATSLIVSNLWGIITLVTIGIILAMCGIYLIVPTNLKQDLFLKNIAN